MEERIKEETEIIIIINKHVTTVVALFSSSFTFSFDERHGAGLEEGAKKKQWRLFIGSTFGPFES